MAVDTKAVDTRDAMAIATAMCARSMQTLEESKKHLGERTAAGALARGKVFSIAAEYGEAAACFAEALSMDPALTEAAARVPLALLKAGQPEKALTRAMALAARQPEFIVQELVSNEKISAMTILGEALLANGRLDQAKDAYSAAHKISAQDTYAVGRLAQLHIATGQPKDAVGLAPQFAANPRACFRGLNAVLPLGNTNASLLPRITTDSLVASLTHCMPGRPILSDGTAQVAPLVWGNEDWCADVPGDPAQ